MGRCDMTTTEDIWWESRTLEELVTIASVPLIQQQDESMKHQAAYKAMSLLRKRIKNAEFTEKPTHLLRDFGIDPSSGSGGQGSATTG